MNVAKQKKLEKTRRASFEMPSMKESWVVSDGAIMSAIPNRRGRRRRGGRTKEQEEEQEWKIGLRLR
jgi:hypothetical protein